MSDSVDYTVHGILEARILGWVSLSLLQGIFPIQGSNPGLQHCRWILYQLSHKKLWTTRHRFIEQSFRLCGRRRGWDVSREQH